MIGTNLIVYTASEEKKSSYIETVLSALMQKTVWSFQTIVSVSKNTPGQFFCHSVALQSTCYQKTTRYTDILQKIDRVICLTSEKLEDIDWLDPNAFWPSPESFLVELDGGFSKMNTNIRIHILVRTRANGTNDEQRMKNRKCSDPNIIHTYRMAEWPSFVTQVFPSNFVPLSFFVASDLLLFP